MQAIEYDCQFIFSVRELSMTYRGVITGCLRVSYRLRCDVSGYKDGIKIPREWVARARISCLVWGRERVPQGLKAAFILRDTGSRRTPAYQAWLTLRATDLEDHDSEFSVVRTSVSAVTRPEQCVRLLVIVFPLSMKRCRPRGRRFLAVRIPFRKQLSCA